LFSLKNYQNEMSLCV